MQKTNVYFAERALVHTIALHDSILHYLHTENVQVAQIITVVIIFPCSKDSFNFKLKVTTAATYHDI